MQLLTFAVGAAAAFLLLPQAEALTLPWVMRQTVAWYGWEAVETVRTVWICLLALLIFTAVRATLGLILSTVGLALVTRLLSGRRGGMRP